MITIDEFKKKYATRSRLIGIDLGSKRIGIGISDEYRKIATPYKTINKTTIDDLIKQLKEIISENNIKGIIIGNPINMDGTLGKSSQSAKDTANNLSNFIDIPICLWDERLSTVGAFNISSQLDINVSKREKDIDKNAAAFILQGALDFLNN
tara:strand:+ start:820 stop:1275 length:456 start_codon:yes stop_codon:yes gene_type:complete